MKFLNDGQEIWRLSTGIGSLPIMIEEKPDAIVQKLPVDG
jgi:hypothetical protein